MRTQSSEALNESDADADRAVDPGGERQTHTRASERSARPEQPKCRAQQLIAGTAKHFANTSSLAFASATLTPAQVTSSLQTLVHLRTGVDTAKATTKARLADEKAQAPTLRSTMAAFESFVRATFSNSPDVLADFGLTKKVRTPLTVEAKAAAAAKRKATRAARKTMRSKQKKAVKGAVTGVIVTPVSASQPIATVSTGPSTPAPSTGATAGATPRTA